jgi:hypothetical protein
MAKIVFDSEKELEDYICTHLDAGWNPITKGDIGWYGRQVGMGSYGVADLMTTRTGDDGTIVIEIIELKKQTITTKAIAQISRYIAGMLHYVHEHHPEKSFYVAGLLVSTEIDLSDDTVYLADRIDDIYFHLASFDLDAGITFNPHPCGWRQTHPGFSNFHKGFVIEMDRVVASNSVAALDTSKHVERND